MSSATNADPSDSASCFFRHPLNRGRGTNSYRNTVILRTGILHPAITYVQHIPKQLGSPSFSGPAGFMSPGHSTHAISNSPVGLSIGIGGLGKRRHLESPHQAIWPTLGARTPSLLHHSKSQSNFSTGGRPRIGEHTHINVLRSYVLRTYQR
jgi:hypothetical protein